MALLAWYRKLIANKFDGSKFRQRVGRPRIDEEAERLVVLMAKENPGWGYDRTVGALKNLGHQLSHQTVGNILRRHGLSPAPKRKQAISSYVRYHHEDRTHLGLEKGTPNGRIRSIASGRVLAHERVGGLHHRYDRAA